MSSSIAAASVCTNHGSVVSNKTHHPSGSAADSDSIIGHFDSSSSSSGGDEEESDNEKQSNLGVLKPRRSIHIPLQPSDWQGGHLPVTVTSECSLCCVRITHPMYSRHKHFLYKGFESPRRINARTYADNYVAEMDQKFDLRFNQYRHISNNTVEMKCDSPDSEDPSKCVFFSTMHLPRVVDQHWGVRNRVPSSNPRTAQWVARCVCLNTPTLTRYHGRTMDMHEFLYFSSDALSYTVTHADQRSLLDNRNTNMLMISTSAESQDKLVYSRPSVVESETGIPHFYRERDRFVVLTWISGKKRKKTFGFNIEDERSVEEARTKAMTFRSDSTCYQPKAVNKITERKKHKRNKTQTHTHALTQVDR